MAKTETQKADTVTITAPNFKQVAFKIEGTAPLVINAFSRRSRDEIKATQMAGSVSQSKKKREPKDFDAAYEGAKHIATDGWLGIHAGAFRCGMISACRLVGFKMTLAKLVVEIVADGFDALDGVPLVKITKGEPYPVDHVVRVGMNQPDIRRRPMWNPGWQAIVRTRWDADVFAMQDVTNLMTRVGRQVGIGEGRNDSKGSAGMGWGFFKIIEMVEENPSMDIGVTGITS